MAKIDIIISLKNNDSVISFSGRGLLNNNVIIFKKDDELMKFSLMSPYYFVRETGDLKYMFDISNSLLEIMGKVSFQSEIKVINYDVFNNKILFDYCIDDQIFKMKVSYEVIYD